MKRATAFIHLRRKTKKLSQHIESVENKYRYFCLPPALEPREINCSNEVHECPFTIIHPRFWTSSCIRV